MEDEIKLDRANKLREQLQRLCEVGNEVDILSKYRQWLDHNNIPAETTDGWPTEQAYELQNVQMFSIANKQ